MPLRKRCFAGWAMLCCLRLVLAWFGRQLLGACTYVLGTAGPGIAHNGTGRPLLKLRIMELFLPSGLCFVSCAGARLCTVGSLQCQTETTLRSGSEGIWPTDSGCVQFSVTSCYAAVQVTDLVEGEIATATREVPHFAAGSKGSASGGRSDAAARLASRQRLATKYSRFEAEVSLAGRLETVCGSGFWQDAVP